MKSIINSFFFLFLAMFCASSHGQGKNYFLSYDFFLNKGVSECERKDFRKHESFVEIFNKRGIRYISFTNNNQKTNKTITFEVNDKGGVTIFTRQRQYAGLCYSDSVFLMSDRYFIFSKTIIPCGFDTLCKGDSTLNELTAKDFWFFSASDSEIIVTRLRTHLDVIVNNDMNVFTEIPAHTEWYGSLIIDDKQIIRKNTYPEEFRPIGYSDYFNKDLKNKSFMFDLLYWIFFKADY